MSGNKRTLVNIIKILKGSINIIDIDIDKYIVIVRFYNMLTMVYNLLITLILKRFLKTTKNNHIYNNLLLVTQLIFNVNFNSKNLKCEEEKKKKCKVYKFY